MAALQGRSLVSGPLALAWTGHDGPARDGELFCLADRSLPAGADPARMYREAGDDALAGLRGSFALALWDAGSERGLLAVDPLARGPLFTAEAGGALFFASELADLLRLLPRTPSPDRTGAVRWLANGSLQPGRTLYDGVRRLTGGELVRLGPEGWSSRQYWAPRYAPVRRSREEAVDAVREGLKRAIAARLPPDGPAGILLSGGIDSASVAAVAALEAGRAGAPLRSYSALFPDQPAVDESERIATVNAHLGLAASQLSVRPGSMLAAALEYLERWRLPSPSPNLVFQLPLLRRAAAEGTPVLLDGQGGDELFGLAAYLVADRVRGGRLASAIALARRFPGVGDPPNRRAIRRLFVEFGLKGALPAWTHRLARSLHGPERYAPEWLTAESARIVVETSANWQWKDARAPLWWSQLADELTRQRERLGAHDYLRRRNELAGVTGGHPLLDDLDLIGLVLTLPPELAYDSVLDRPLLRRSVAGLLPESVLLRPEKSYFNAFFRACLEGPDRPALERLLGRREAGVWAYAREDVVRERLLAAPPERRDGAWAWALWRLAGLECWLLEQAEPGSAATLVVAAERGLSRAGGRAPGAPRRRS